MTDAANPLPGLHALLATVARLRAPDGCPWDREQTVTSMARHLLEEAFEAVDALRRGDAAAMREELGDVLVNVAMIAQIASENGTLTCDDVAAAAAAKLVRRHPHVFGGERADGAEDVHRRWEQQKAREREAAAAGDVADVGDAVAGSNGAGAAARSVLGGVPLALPSLLRAFRIGEKAARAGFDWPDRAGPRAKVDEELAELDAALAEDDREQVAAELGDVLFSLCNLARHAGVDPEMALAGTTARFQRRFAAVERALGYRLEGRSLAELDVAWEQAKAEERRGG